MTAVSRGAKYKAMDHAVDLPVASAVEYIGL